MTTIEEIGNNALNLVQKIEFPDDIDQYNINELLYTFNESGQWNSFIDIEEAVLCWKIIETVRLLDKLPENVKL